MFKLKNFDKKNFLNTIKKYKKIIIYDENSEYGGIVSILSNFFIERKLNLNIKILASKDNQIFFYSQNRDDMLKKLKIDEEKLIEIIKQF